MREEAIEDLTAVIPALLQALERLAFVSRYLNPPQFAEVLAACGEPEAPLMALRPNLELWPDEMAALRDGLSTALDEALIAWDGLRTAEDLTGVFRALGRLPRAQEALYPLVTGLPPVSRYFLDSDLRQDGAKLAALSQPRPDTGVQHFDNEPGTRGGYSLYVPEDWDGAPLPLVVALHGGSGNGRSFLWSWLRDARSFGALLVAPTAVGRTWAIQGPDPDTPNLARILDAVRGRWPVDETRLLLAGMSDGGTFAYVSGLEPGSPFTHLAPTSAAFHPMMASFADAARMKDLPILITHGALDWMFDVGMARGARDALAAAGAKVTYREVDDLAHTYPRELNKGTLDWLRST